ncbi:IS6 family transposase [Candidatus Williamhamiltonella defendens]|nr:IS6 family transposase [Candidatus Hamiltonella defensa]
MAPFRGRHFEPEVILWAVRCYCKQGISYRELKEMLSERGGQGCSHPDLPLGSTLCP